MIIPFKESWSEQDPHIAAVQTGINISGQAMPKRVDKTWGYELHYINDIYCQKLLRFHGETPEPYAEASIDFATPPPELCTSMHFHVTKHETLLVTSGILTLQLIINKKRFTYKLPEGTAWVVAPGHIHRLCAYDGPVDVVEASTFDHPDDSYRIE